MCSCSIGRRSTRGKLGTWPAGKVIRTGNVGERYATFFVGSKRAYFPYLYDSQTKTRTRIPSTQPYAWGPVVDETNGMVYLAASGNACGANANIWRLADLARWASNQDRRPTKWR